MIGTFDWHVQTDTFYSDARFAQMFSVDPAKGEKGAPLSEYVAGIHPEDVERITAAVNGAVATGEKYIQEYRLLQKDGTIRWVEARGECLKGENTEPTNFVGVVVDITPTPANAFEGKPHPGWFGLTMPSACGSAAPGK